MDAFATCPEFPLKVSHARVCLCVCPRMFPWPGGTVAQHQEEIKKIPVTIGFSMQVKRSDDPHSTVTAFYVCATPETLFSREERGTLNYSASFSPLDTETLQHAVRVFQKGLHCQLQLAAQRSDILSGSLLVTFPHTLAHTKTPVKHHPTYVASRRKQKK